MILIGPLPVKSDAIGGTKVSFAAMADFFARSLRFSVTVLNTSREKQMTARVGIRAQGIGVLLRVSTAILFHRPPPDVVVLNISSGALVRAGPLLWLIARWRKAPLVLRVFGGDFEVSLGRASPMTRWLAHRTFLRSALVLLQTRYLVDRFSGKLTARWLPTTRDMPAVRTEEKVCRKLLFLGQLRREKGIKEIAEAARQLEPRFSVTIAGPIIDPSVRNLLGTSKLHYLGEVAPRDVPKLLGEHDLLLYPSYHEGEGYPGVVIEAMQCGIPVIAARWRSIPELVLDGENGLLIEPGSARQLAAAVTRMADEPGLYARLSEGARRAGDKLRTSRVLAELENELVRIAGG